MKDERDPMTSSVKMSTFLIREMAREKVHLLQELRKQQAQKDAATLVRRSNFWTKLIPFVKPMTIDEAMDSVMHENFNYEFLYGDQFERARMILHASSTTHAGEMFVSIDDLDMLR